jgi:hypothetical protein
MLGTLEAEQKNNWKTYVVELCGSVVSFYEYICHNGKSILLHPWTFLASENGPSVIIDWTKTQEKDTRLQYWRKMVETGQKPEKEDTILKRQFSHLHFINDVLHRLVTNNDKVQHFPGRYLMLML